MRRSLKHKTENINPDSRSNPAKLIHDTPFQVPSR